jgi:hypothetical protein
MRESAERVHEFREPRGIASLWFSMLAGPVAWMLGLNADYSLVRVACAKGTMLPLHLVTLATLALAVAGGLVAWRDWQRAGREWPGEAGTTLDRSRFMSVVGLMGSALFALTIVAQWLAKLFLDPCVAI